MAKDCLLYMGGKRVFAKVGKRVFSIYGWQKSVYCLLVAKESLVYMGGKYAKDCFLYRVDKELSS